MDSRFLPLLPASPLEEGDSSGSLLNNYVAVHYSNRDMNWLHCMWGLGAATGPYIMGMCLQESSWQAGYRIVGIVQVVLTGILFLSLPLWKKRRTGPENHDTAPVRLLGIFRIPGAKEVMVTFFCYCALEQTAILWSTSYFALAQGLDEKMAAFYGSLFLVGLTVGRFLSGFAAMRFSDAQLIRFGQGLMLAGILFLFFAVIPELALVGFLLLGLGCAPVYPSIIHTTPALFGEDRSLAMVGVEMASAYVGSLLMPPLFGILAQAFGAALLPIYLLILLAAMMVFFSQLIRKTKKILPAAER